jgi:hypothetical protein
VTTNSGRDVLDFNTVTDPVGDNNCGLERVVGLDSFQRKYGEQSRGTSASCSLHGASKARPGQSERAGRDAHRADLAFRQIARAFQSSASLLFGWF